MLQNTTLEHYLSKFKKLRQGGTQYGKAPHKPILLLSVLHQIEQGRVTDNQFYLTPEWVSDFVDIFKRLIPRLYDHTCSISRMRTQSTHGYQLIDACHIKPISLSNDDTVSNGFALSPTLHRAFDRGIIGVNPDYSVRISRYITEDEAVVYSLNKLKGIKLHLPIVQSHYPAIENFVWHLENRFEK